MHCQQGGENIHQFSLKGGGNFWEKMCISLFSEKISALHALVQGEYAFVQGELLLFA
jgi:hypothetical protein